jgi:hypothetical protein
MRLAGTPSSSREGNRQQLQRGRGAREGSPAEARARDPAGQNREATMHMVVRHYAGKGAGDLAGILEGRKADIEAVLRPIKGFVSYLAARTGDGVTTVTVCETKAGTEESVTRARDWIAQNAKALAVAPPVVSEGAVFIHAK